MKMFKVKAKEEAQVALERKGFQYFSHMNTFRKGEKKGINHNEGFTAQSRLDERRPIHLDRSVISHIRLLNLQLLGEMM